jgi:hypothetical protein
MRQLSRLTTSAGFALLFVILPLLAFAQQDRDLQYINPYDQRGINTFEAPTQDTVGYDGFNVVWGAGFTQQFQGLDHSNAAGTLPDLGPGFNLATANLNLDAQLARGIRVNLITYLSSRHHPEAWVKGGYLQIDELPMFDNPGLNNLMDYLMIRAGHFEINYGDGHFRRTDNGHALHNPFVGNYVLDAFTTEIGGEVYVRPGNLLLMGAITGGEINGGVTNPDARAPSFYGKVGYDRQLTPDLRFRLTGSAYTTASSAANHLHSGDRAGSRYYSVVEGGDWSGRIRGNFSDDVTAFMVNPFVKFRGLELFGLIENVTGSRVGDSGDGTMDHYAAEAIYRFADDDLYVGARYNYFEGELNHGARGAPANWTSGNTLERWQIGAGWFTTEKLLLKAEYVTQTYDGFPTGSTRNGGEFSGVMIEGVISF